VPTSSPIDTLVAFTVYYRTFDVTRIAYHGKVTFINLIKIYKNSDWLIKSYDHVF
jgi:hypothetical protein